MDIKKMALSLSATMMVLHAGTIENELGINVGVTSIKNEGTNKFNNMGVSATYQMNRYVVSPRFDFDYVNINDFEGVDALFRASVNGVYEINTAIEEINPYILMGVGYEKLSKDVEDEFESLPFVQGGGGLAYNLPNTSSRMRFEGKVLKVLGAKDQEHELLLNAGMMMPIGGESKERTVSNYARAVVQPKPVVIKETVPVYIDSHTCPKKINEPDRDRDGIPDVKDQCPDTPCDFTVDSYGCPVKTTLQINFRTASAEIESASMSRVLNFANFLLANKGSHVQIVGHTDSVGSNTYNVGLSQRRAQSVMNQLVSYGVSPARITAIGMGESAPIASNSTATGRGQNRRIEAVLSYPSK
ncbi:MAG: OmpA family protein [Campylobacterales bacterium]|nr:OmpA family protein [Campylobacterales bacterium]